MPNAEMHRLICFVQAESDGACPDALMDDMATPCIGASLEGRQQSGEEVPSAQTF
jgi:hypothetical protein